MAKGGPLSSTSITINPWAVMQIDLSVQDVTKKFQEFIAVNSVSFEVRKGSFFSILGPSGCGKTTLLRMIAGLTEPSNGRIEIRQYLDVTLSFDHDIIDGAPAARFTNQFKDLVESCFGLDLE